MQSCFVSVVITTRSRPEECLRAIESVMMQTLIDKQVIVVIDGISERLSEAYQALQASFSEKITFTELPYRINGHGPSFARNHGVSLARGKYIAFLDDDDVWTDYEHLNTFCHEQILHSDSAEVDVYITHQEAWLSNGQNVLKNIWLEELIVKLEDKRSKTVDINFLLNSNGFAHLNTLIVKSELFNKVEGFDENLRYEEDRDFYYRVIDNAEKIMFTSFIIGKHFIPDKRPSASSEQPKIKRYLYQLNSSQKLQLTCSSDVIRNAMTINACYALKNLAVMFDEKGDASRAFSCASQALAQHFTFRYYAYLFVLKVKYMVRNIL